MEVSGEQKRNHINQKKRQSEKSPHSNMVVVCNLDDEQISPKDSGKKIKKEKYCESEGRRGENKMTHESNLQSCIDKLREELSCPICLEICYEPTTTWCGHSFCRRCLELVLIKFDKCPKCRRFISKDGSDKVNIWNTIQLFFPQEVIAKRFAIFDEMAESVLGKNKHIRWEQE